MDAGTRLLLSLYHYDSTTTSPVRAVTRRITEVSCFAIRIYEFMHQPLPFDAVLDELVRRNTLAKLRAAAVDALVQPTIRVNPDRLRDSRAAQHKARGSTTRSVLGMEPKEDHVPLAS